MKKVILAGIILAASQNVMAWGFSDLFSASDDATETVSDTTKAANAAVTDTTKKAEEVQAAAEKIQNKGLTETATVVVKESGKGAITGAAAGIATGTVVDSGTKGGVDAGKKALSGFGF